MKISELVNILGVDKLAPIHLMENYDEEKFAECKHLTEEEKNDFQKSCWIEGKDYDTSELGVYLANVDVEKYYEFEYKYNPWQLKEIIDDISFLFFLKFEDVAIIYATYAILHEVGHWINFKKSGMTSIEYAKWDYSYRYEANKYSERLRRMSNSIPIKWADAKEAVAKYRNIPAEKMADEYAFENLKSKLQILNIETRTIRELY